MYNTSKPNIEYSFARYYKASFLFSTLCIWCTFCKGVQQCRIRCNVFSVIPVHEVLKWVLSQKRVNGSQRNFKLIQSLVTVLWKKSQKISGEEKSFAISLRKLFMIVLIEIGKLSPDFSTLRFFQIILRCFSGSWLN